jgi:hypothetical protein
MENGVLRPTQRYVYVQNVIVYTIAGNNEIYSLNPQLRLGSSRSTQCCVITCNMQLNQSLVILYNFFDSSIV